MTAGWDHHDDGDHHSVRWTILAIIAALMLACALSVMGQLALQGRMPW